jgi:tetratricopeptide (TPR) repeat protein
LPDQLTVADPGATLGPVGTGERLPKSKGGSVLVTGYRGTGKTSLVNQAITAVVDDERRKGWRKWKLPVLSFLMALVCILSVSLFIFEFILTGLTSLNIATVINGDWPRVLANAPHGAEAPGRVGWVLIGLAVLVELLFVSYFKRHLVRPDSDAVLRPISALWHCMVILLSLSTIGALHVGELSAYTAAAAVVAILVILVLARQRLLKTQLDRLRAVGDKWGPILRVVLRLTAVGCATVAITWLVLLWPLILQYFSIITPYLTICIVIGLVVVRARWGRARFAWPPPSSALWMGAAVVVLASAVAVCYVFIIEPYSGHRAVFDRLVAADPGLVQHGLWTLSLFLVCLWSIKLMRFRASSRWEVIRVNLSSSRRAEALAEIMIRELHVMVHRGVLFNSSIRKLVERSFRRSRGFSRYVREGLGGVTSGSTQAAASGAVEPTAASMVSGLGLLARLMPRRSVEYTEGPYTLHDAQRDILDILSELKKSGRKVIFVFDELDKLIPAKPDESSAPYDQKLADIQQIVSDLKFLLTESNAHHVFIAGKNVDDSWQEDQNKGEGLFESVFVQNIYLPSTLTVQLTAASGPHADWIDRQFKAWLADGRVKLQYVDKPSGFKGWLIDRRNKLWPPYERRSMQRQYLNARRQELVDGLFEVMLNELSIQPINWTYNTGLLVLPYLSQNELAKIVLRAAGHRRGSKGDPDRKFAPHYGKVPSRVLIEPYLDWLRQRLDEHGIAVAALDKPAKDRRWSPYDETVRDLQPFLDTDGTGSRLPNVLRAGATERRCRRVRYLLQYLTYKGRGIPRKILREFYTLANDKAVMRGKDEDYWIARGADHIVYIPAPLRQKIKFFSNIVNLLESHQDIFRNVDDKGCVSVFHIIDYIMKFYQTGFTWSDIENANFMTEREELFPSRELVVMLLHLLEDVIIERADRRNRSYMLLPQIKHDLAGLFLAFGPEQIELRFTGAEFAHELAAINRRLEQVDRTKPEQRLESFKMQIRLGQIRELLGDTPEAIIAYSKALRWIRMDLERLITRGERPKDAIQVTSIVNYLSSGVEVLQRLGYLYELEREFRRALHYYQSAVRFHEFSREIAGHGQTVLGDGIHIHESGESGLPRGDAGIWDALEHLHSECDVARLALQAMVPTAEPEEVFPYCDPRPPGKGDDPLPLYTALDPYGLPRSLNSMAIVLEKMWHRYACNRFLLNALNYYQRINDEYDVSDQMIMIGEVMLRRRDPRLAARWYRAAWEHRKHYHVTDHLDQTSKQPELQSSSTAKLFEHMGDVFFATHGTAFLKSRQMVKLLEGTNPKPLEELVEDEILGFEKNDGDRSWGMALAPDDRTEEFFYTQAAQLYSINKQSLRECDVYLKKLAVRQQALAEVMGV